MMSHPEFWSGLAFVIVIVLACRPASVFLAKWTKRQDEEIQKARTQASDLCQQAEQLRKEYEQAYVGRFDWRQKKLKETEAEINVLVQEIEEQTKNRIAQQKRDMVLRLKTIEENGNGQLKRQLARQIMETAEQKLKRHHESESSEDVLQKAFQAIDMCYKG